MPSAKALKNPCDTTVAKMIALARKRDAIVEELKRLSRLAEAARTHTKTVAIDSGAAFDPREAGRKLVEDLRHAEGGAWSGDGLAREFGLSPSTLHKRRKEHRIVYWRDAKSRFHYPRWQFTPAGALLPGVLDVLQIFQSSDEWRVISYFLAPRNQLEDRTPLELLRAGKVKEVLAHARANEQENSW